MAKHALSSWAQFGLSWISLKQFSAIVEATLSHLGVILGSSRAILGPPQGYPGPYWGCLGASWGRLGAILRPSGATLGASWGHVGQSLAI